MLILLGQRPESSYSHLVSKTSGNVIQGVTVTTRDAPMILGFQGVRIPLGAGTKACFLSKTKFLTYINKRISKFYYP